MSIFLRVIKALIFLQKVCWQIEILRRARGLASNSKTISIKPGERSPGPCPPWRELFCRAAGLLCVWGHPAGIPGTISMLCASERVWDIDGHAQGEDAWQPQSLQVLRPHLPLPLGSSWGRSSNLCSAQPTSAAPFVVLAASMWSAEAVVDPR